MAPLSGTGGPGDARPAPVTKAGQGARPNTEPAAVPATRSGAFLPILLCALALMGWFALQLTQLLDERAGAQATHAAQQQTVDNAAKLRGSLDALAADTQRLADTGNANARTLVEELKKRGVTINPAAASTPAIPSR